MDRLYYEDGCSCCHGFSNAAEGIRFSPDVLATFLRKVYNGFDTSHDIEPTAWREALRLINEATVEGLSRADVPPTHEEEFYRELRHSNEVFAAFKVHSMGEKMAAKLTTQDGKLKPFRQWAEEVQGISSHYVGSWLRTEYDTAIIRAHTAADWRRFERDKDIMPNLRWMPTTSPEPDSAHRVYWQNKLTLPVDHPFWNRHHPGDRWNCKCMLEQTDEPANPEVLDGIEDTPPQRGLENNPGKDGHTFNDTHPYFPKNCSSCPVYHKSGIKNRLLTLFENRKKDCYNCPFIDGCLYGLNKDEIKDIKKLARQSFQGKSLSHPQFDGDIQISRRSIDEWTNQPHRHYAEKNRMILHIDAVLEESKYLGVGNDKSTKPGSKWIHLFETKIRDDKSWIIVKEYEDGNKMLYSITDGADILKALK